MVTIHMRLAYWYALLKIAAGVGGLKLAFVLLGIFIRLAPTNELQNNVKHELPENLGYYSCTRITNVGKYNFAIEKLFPTVRENSTNQYGWPTTHSQKW